MTTVVLSSPLCDLLYDMLRDWTGKKFEDMSISNPEYEVRGVANKTIPPQILEPRFDCSELTALRQ